MWESGRAKAISMRFRPAAASSAGNRLMAAGGVALEVAIAWQGIPWWHCSRVDRKGAAKMEKAASGQWAGGRGRTAARGGYWNLQDLISRGERRIPLAFRPRTG